MVCHSGKRSGIDHHLRSVYSPTTKLPPFSSESGSLFVLLGGSILLRLGILLRQGIVLAVQTSGLLLEVLEVLVLLGQRLLKTSDLTRLPGHGELLGLFGVLVGALVVLDLLLKTQDLENHNVRPVEDEGEEKGEAAEVHVALGVELAGLHLETFVAHDGGSTKWRNSSGQ